MLEDNIIKDKIIKIGVYKVYITHIVIVILYNKQSMLKFYTANSDLSTKLSTEIIAL